MSVTRLLPQIVSTLCVSLVEDGAALAQAYPSRPIHIIVPSTAGGPGDILARAMGARLTDAWGQQVIVDNKPGANEMIAAEATAKSAPDGYTILLASEAVFTLNTFLYSKISYDPVRDFAPVSRLIHANMVLVARTDFPAATIQDLIRYAKENPGKVNYGSVGTGGV